MSGGNGEKNKKSQPQQAAGCEPNLSNQGSEDFEERVIQIFNDRHEKYVNIAIGYVKDYSTAEDVIQEAFSRALLNKDKYKHDNNFKGWINTIVRNTSINYYREIKKIKDKKIISINEDNGIFVMLYASNTDNRTYETLGEFTEKPHALNLNELLEDCIQEIPRALRELNQEFRDVFVWCKVYGMNCREASELLKIPVGTVMSRLHRAREELKRRLNWVYEDLYKALERIQHHDSSIKN